MKKKDSAPRQSHERGAQPSRQDLIDYLKQNPDATKRDLARHFKIKSSDKIELKRLLREMADEGEIKAGPRRKFSTQGVIPEVCVVEIIELSADGDALCKPTNWDADAEHPRIIIAFSRETAGEGRTLSIGERCLVRLKQHAKHYDAKVIKRLGIATGKTVGIFRKLGRQGRVEPVDRKSKITFVVAEGDTAGAADGDIVVVEPITGKSAGLPRGRIKERVGKSSEARTISLIAIHSHGIPDSFPHAAIEEAERWKPATLEKDRADLRRVPLVTIDPPDARDHDDAVWAASDTNPANKGGFTAIVGIADVSYYVRPSSALDREALRRGNSVYFPDRVVPMLPEILSADLCSLKESQDRAIIACHLVFDHTGKLKSHRFERALMRSAARLTYEEVQAAIDGHPNDKTRPLLEPILKPLYECYRLMEKARTRRSPLDLDLPERRIQLNEAGRVSSIAVRERLDAHRLIEEFMIQANVAAAEALETKKCPLLFRVHAPPATEKLLALAEFLETLNIKLAVGQTVTTAMLNRILQAAAGTPNAELVNMVMLRSMSQAEYNPENIGHFGLALRRYGHFTSPIRRYADLIVHRALVRSFSMGEGGLTDREVEHLARIGEDVSAFERRAMAAERDSNDRYVSAFMSDRVGAEFYGTISGVTRFGLFVRLSETGADGFVPIRSIGREFFHHDERRHTLSGESTGLTFKLGARVKVRLEEATPLSGGLRFEMLEGGTAGTPAKKPIRKQATHSRRKRR